MFIQEPIKMIGRYGQLPPKFRHQPALDIQTLGMNYKEVEHIELDEVMRQEENSGILHNATELRNY
jgi:hypothetical protein